MIRRQAVTALIGGTVLVSVLSGAVMVRWMEPGSKAAASVSAGEAGLYPDGTALRRLGGKMILR
jgi:hypothetical protein